MMRQLRSFAVVGAATAWITLATVPVCAFDLGGTWAGKVSCRGVFEGAPQTVSSTRTLLVEDGGSTLELAVDGSHYSAVPYPNPEHPEKGELAVIRCDTNSSRSGGEFGGEFGRMKVATKAIKGTGSLGGTSFKASVLIARSLYTCKWSFKRVSVEHVALDGCTTPPPPG
jgi:hypothetical protein